MSNEKLEIKNYFQLDYKEQKIWMAKIGELYR